MALTEKLQIVELGAANEVVVLLDLNDGVHYMMEQGTFQVIAPEATPVLAAEQRRWGGSREVGEVHQNGGVEWVAGVTATTEQAALEKVETLLAQLAANPYHAFVLWQVPGAAQPTLYEMRGTGTWAAKYSVAQVEGAQLFLFTVHIPVGPLAQGLPKVQYEKSSLTLPETLVLGTIPGDAPAKAEVAIETGYTTESSFLAAHKPYGIAVDSTYIYFANSETGYIGRAKLNGTSPEQTWLHTEATGVVAIAVDSGHIYWNAGLTGYIGRATIAGTSIEKTWLHTEADSEGIAVNATNIFWTSESTHIGRATIAGATIEKTWLATFAPSGITLTGTHIYWTCASENTIGRALLSTPASTEPRFITGASRPLGIANDGQYLYWANESISKIGRCLLDGEEVTQTWAFVSEPSFLAVGKEYVYVTYGPNAVARVILRPAPVWALLGWASKPTAGLAPAPFGVLEATAATLIEGWTLGASATARGGQALTGNRTRGGVFWEVDPATMAPDSFSGELTVEVLARVLVGEALSSPMLTVSAQPQDGQGFGAARYTDEWGSAGRPLALPEGNEKWRMTRLGTLHLLCNPLSPRIWKIVLQGESDAAAVWGVNYLVLVPALQRACSPTGKANNASYPAFIANIAPTVKTIRSNLSALVAKPGKNGHPDHGLGGQLMELPPGETDLLIKLSSLVPDPPASVPASPISESLSVEGTVTVWVTPRFFLTRTV